MDALDALADVFVFRFGRDGDDTFGAVGGGVLGGALFRGHVFAGAEPRHRPASGAGVEHVRNPRARVDVAEVGMLRGFGRRVDGDVLVSVRVLPSRRRVRLLRVREDARGLGLDRLVRRVALEAIAGRVRDVGDGLLVAVQTREHGRHVHVGEDRRDRPLTRGWDVIGRRPECLARVVRLERLLARDILPRGGVFRQTLLTLRLLVDDPIGRLHPPTRHRAREGDTGGVKALSARRSAGRREQDEPRGCSVVRVARPARRLVNIPNKTRGSLAEVF